MKKIKQVNALLLLILIASFCQAQAPYGIPPGTNQAQTPDNYYNETSLTSTTNGITWLSWSICDNWPKRNPIVSCPSVTGPGVCKMDDLERTGNYVLYDEDTETTFKTIVWDGCNPSFSLQVLDPSGVIIDEIIVRLKGSFHGVVKDPDVILKKTPGQPYIDVVMVYQLDNKYIALEQWEYNKVTQQLQTKVYYASLQDFVISHDNVSIQPNAPVYTYNPNIDVNNTGKVVVVYQREDFTNFPIDGEIEVVCKLYNPNVANANPLGASKRFFVSHLPSYNQPGSGNFKPDVSISDNETFNAVVSFVYHDWDNTLIIAQADFTKLWRNRGSLFTFQSYNDDYKTYDDPRVCSPNHASITNKFEIAVAILNDYQQPEMLSNFSNPAFTLYTPTVGSVVEECSHEKPAISYGGKNKVIIGWTAKDFCHNYLSDTKALAVNYDVSNSARTPIDNAYVMEINEQGYETQIAVSLAENSIMAVGQEESEVFYSNIAIYDPSNSNFGIGVVFKTSKPYFQPLLRKKQAQSIEESKETKVEVFPNPSQGQFSLNFSSEKYNHLIVRDIQGKLVKEVSLNQDNYLLDISNYTNGVYFLTLQGAEENTTTKITKF